MERSTSAPPSNDAATQQKANFHSEVCPTSRVFVSTHALMIHSPGELYDRPMTVTLTYLLVPYLDSISLHNLYIQLSSHDHDHCMDLSNLRSSYAMLNAPFHTNADRSTKLTLEIPG